MNFATFSTGLLFFLLALFAVIVVTTTDGRPTPPAPIKRCVETKKQTVITYPFIGMVGTNIPLAMTPVPQEQTICVQWETLP